MKRLLLWIPAVLGFALAALVTRSDRTAAPRDHRRPGWRRAHPVLGFALAAVLAFGTVGGTYAAFSDFALIGGNQAGAGTLIVTSGNHLEVELPASPSSGADQLTVENTGTTPADLGLSLVPDEATTALCSPASAGDVLLTLVGTSADGTDDRVSVGDICGPLGDLTWPGLDTLDPAGVTEATIDLQVDLGADAHPAWSRANLTFQFEVTGDQPGGGFSDFATGTFTVHIGILPPLDPKTCPGNPLDHPIQVHLGNGNESWAPTTNAEKMGPAYITAGNGTVTITGTDGDDCIIVENGNATIYGGAGHDTIVVGNGTTTVHGGPGNDTIVSEHPNGNASGGGKATLYGDEGNDHLIARRGNVTLVGGDGIDTCTVPAALDADCEFVNGVEVAATDEGFAPAGRVDLATIDDDVKAPQNGEGSGLEGEGTNLEGEGTNLEGEGTNLEGEGTNLGGEGTNLGGGAVHQEKVTEDEKQDTPTDPPSDDPSTDGEVEPAV